MKKNRGTNIRRLIGSGIALGMIAVLSSCASTQPPMQRITESQAAINQAEQVGAGDYAPLEIRQARKKLEKAKALVDREKFELAKRLADQAKIDAELAEARSLSEKAQKAVRELREGIRILKEEIERNQQGN